MAVIPKSAFSYYYIKHRLTLNLSIFLQAEKANLVSVRSILKEKINYVARPVKVLDDDELKPLGIGQNNSVVPSLSTATCKQIHK